MLFPPGWQYCADKGAAIKLLVATHNFCYVAKPIFRNKGIADDEIHQDAGSGKRLCLC
jgi:ectoine hydroxylase-related dioxygenase (phytanoyl-CoA dioxygenase family)